MHIQIDFNTLIKDK